MQKRVTIKQIAELAGVSVATASVAINGKDGVSAEKREEILSIAEELHYFANAGARMLKTQRSFCIGLIVTDIENPFFSMVVSELNRNAEARGYSIMMFVSRDSAQREANLVGMLISQGVDGIIITPAAQSQMSTAHLKMLKDMKIPFIYCTSYHQAFAAPCVMTELESGEYLMVSHLLSRGCRKIFMLAADPGLVFVQKRVAGYRRAFEERGLPFREDWIFAASPRYEDGYAFAKRIWPQRPDAIVSINDFQAVGMMQAFHEMGVHVPEDISVAGYDDLPFSSMMSIPLSTVSQPVKQICQKTIDLLIEMIETGSRTQDVFMLAPSLIVRDSTR